MSDEKLIQALTRLKVETRSLACLGCGYERNCGTHGCAIIREAVATLTTLTAENERLKGAIQEWIDGKCISQKHSTRIQTLQMNAEELQAKKAQLRSELEQVKRERDAAVKDLRGTCSACYWPTIGAGTSCDGECQECDGCPCQGCANGDQFEWCGPQEE